MLPLFLSFYAGGFCVVLFIIGLTYWHILCIHESLLCAVFWPLTLGGLVWAAFQDIEGIGGVQSVHDYQGVRDEPQYQSKQAATKWVPTDQSPSTTSVIGAR
jgi:hypothetical protein